MTLEEKKARIREELRRIEEHEGDTELWLNTSSPVFANKSPQAMMDANDEPFIDMMLGILEQGHEVWRNEIASGRMIPMSTVN